MQSERWYLLDHPEYIENTVVVGRYGGVNTRLVNVYVLKDGISPTIQVQPFTSTRDFNYVPTITAASWTQKHEGTGESCRKGVRVICVCPANKGKSKTKVERAFPRRVCLMLHARLVIARTPMKTTSATDHTFCGFTGVITHAGCLENTRKACKSRVEGEWFTSFSSVLPTSQVVYHAGKPTESVVCCFYKITLSFLWVYRHINHRFLTNQNARTVLVILYEKKIKGLWVDHGQVTQEKRDKRCNEKRPWRLHPSPNKLT